MAKPAIATPVLSDAATITAGSALATLPASNLQTRQPTTVWRSSALTDLYLVVDLGASAAINLVALWATNASAAATYRVRAAATEADLTASPGYDSGAGLTLWPQSGLGDYDAVPLIHWMATAQSYRWWRIDIADAANAAGYFQAGRLYISAAWQASRNRQYGAGWDFIESSDDEESQGGQVFTDERPRRKVMDFTLDFLTEAEMLGSVLEIMRTRGQSKDVIVLLDPEHASYLLAYSCYGLLRGGRPLSNRRFNLWQKPFRIEELI